MAEDWKPFSSAQAKILTAMQTAGVGRVVLVGPHALEAHAHRAGVPTPNELAALGYLPANVIVEPGSVERLVAFLDWLPNSVGYTLSTKSGIDETTVLQPGENPNPSLSDIIEQGHGTVTVYGERDSERMEYLS